MRIIKITVSAGVKLSANYQSSESSASIEAELDGTEDRDALIAKAGAWLRSVCLREARAGLTEITGQTPAVRELPARNGNGMHRIAL